MRNAPNPRKRSTIKTEVYGASSSLPPLLDRGRKLVWSVDKNASLFSAHFAAAEMVFSRRILVALLRYSILLSFSLVV